MKQLTESMFDPDLVKKDPTILKALKNKKDLLEKVSRWEDRTNTNYTFGTRNLWLPNFSNIYVCVLFGFILCWQGPVTKTKPNFRSDLRRTSVILYLSKFYKTPVDDIIDILEKTGNIQYIKYRDLFITPNSQLCDDPELVKILKNRK